MVEYFPLDFDKLQKGSIVPKEKVEELYNISHTDKLYSLRVLGLREEIERELANRKRPVVTRCIDDAIHILEDAAAAKYTAHQGRAAVRKLVRTHHRALTGVDVSNLTDDERREHDHEIVKNGKYIQAIKQVRREMRLESHKRATPGLPQPNYEEVGAA